MEQYMIKMENVKYKYRSIGEDSQLMAINNINIAIKKRVNT